MCARLLTPEPKSLKIKLAVIRWALLTGLEMIDWRKMSLSIGKLWKYPGLLALSDPLEIAFWCQLDRVDTWELESEDDVNITTAKSLQATIICHPLDRYPNLGTTLESRKICSVTTWKGGPAQLCHGFSLCSSQDDHIAHRETRPFASNNRLTRHWEASKKKGTTAS